MNHGKNRGRVWENFEQKQRYGASGTRIRKLVRILGAVNSVSILTAAIGNQDKHDKEI
jgi:hypothetical protein